MPLTDLKLRNAKPAKEPYRLADGAGLYIWVTPSGGRLWRWKYRFEGKEKLMSLGKYPDVPVAAARERHAAARRALAEGTDPMAERKASKVAQRVSEESSFATVAGKWLNHWQVGKSPRHVDSTRRRLDTNVLPALGEFPVDKIEALEICGMVKSIESRGAVDIAKRALETTGQILRYAVAHG